ncbi:MAG: DNA-formamidopyrimidine glycosylase family protein [Acetobacteraceae bacterium]
MFAEFEDAMRLAMHFGLNGSLVGLSPDEDEPASTRLMFEFAKSARLAYVNPRRNGHVCVTASAASSIADQRLGPDALDPCSRVWLQTTACPKGFCCPSVTPAVTVLAAAPHW